MKYLLIEFLAVFFLIFFRSLAAIVVDHEDKIRLNPSIVNGFIYLIFSILATNLSAGLFNPSFAITQNLFDKLSVGETIGYIGAHIIGALFATSLIPRLLPFENFLDRENLNLGTKKIPEDMEYTSVLTAELLGTMILFLGYLYYKENQKNDKSGEGAVFYGAIAMALGVATYDISGGANNIAVLFGALVFDNVIDFRIAGLFLGNVAGCVIARLLYSKIFGMKVQEEDNKALKMLLKE
jgi:glycerol uptake facilitator-like aquaporin